MRVMAYKYRHHEELKPGNNNNKFCGIPNGTGVVQWYVQTHDVPMQFTNVSAVSK
jgi:hypothetical protein